MTSTLHTKTDRGDFCPMPISDRTSVRHGWAEQIELGRAAGGWDNVPHPFTNWGYKNALAYRLANHDRFAAIKTGKAA